MTLCFVLFYSQVTKIDDNNNKSGLGSVAEDLLSVHKALSSIPSSGKKEGGEGGRGETDR